MILDHYLTYKIQNYPLVRASKLSVLDELENCNGENNYVFIFKLMSLYFLLQFNYYTPANM